MNDFERQFQRENHWQARTRARRESEKLGFVTATTFICLLTTALFMQKGRVR